MPEARKRGPPPPPPPPKARTRYDHAFVSARSHPALFRLFLLYQERPDLSLRRVYDDGEFEGKPFSEYITFATVQVYSSTHGWPRRRDEFWRGVRQRVLEKAQSDIVQRELAEIDEMLDVRAQLRRYIDGDTAAGIRAVKPNSLEGVVNALVRLDERIATKRGITAELLATAAKQEASALPTSTAISQIEDGLSEAEVAEVAHALARKRAQASSGNESEGGNGV